MRLRSAAATLVGPPDHDFASPGGARLLWRNGKAAQWTPAVPVTLGVTVRP